MPNSTFDKLFGGFPDPKQSNEQRNAKPVFEPAFSNISATEKKYSELHGDIVSGGFVISSELKQAVLNPSVQR